MAKKIKGPQILTGNLLSDGTVVFLGPDGSWRSSIHTAQLAHSEENVAALEAIGAEAVNNNLIVDPFLIEVEETATGLVPVALRERRRVAGPSVSLEFNTRPNGQIAVAA